MKMPKVNLSLIGGIAAGGFVVKKVLSNVTFLDGTVGAIVETAAGLFLMNSKNQLIKGLGTTLLVDGVLKVEKSVGLISGVPFRMLGPGAAAGYNRDMGILGVPGQARVVHSPRYANAV